MKKPPEGGYLLMTRAGLEPATYGLKERILIVVLASTSIAKSCPGSLESISALHESLAAERLARVDPNGSAGRQRTRGHDDRAEHADDDSHGRRIARLDSI